MFATGQSYTDITPSHVFATQNGAYSDWNNPDTQINFGADDHNSAATTQVNLKCIFTIH